MYATAPIIGAQIQFMEWVREPGINHNTARDVRDGYNPCDIDHLSGLVHILTLERFTVQWVYELDWKMMRTPAVVANQWIIVATSPFRISIPGVGGG